MIAKEDVLFGVAVLFFLAHGAANLFFTRTVQRQIMKPHEGRNDIGAWFARANADPGTFSTWFRRMMGATTIGVAIFLIVIRFFHPFG
jgi:hypothetical protein